MTPGANTPSSQLSKPQRVLACIHCQNRKIKCERKFPCSNCVKARIQCVPATLAQRRRRRRFPERELLERLRKYEELLRQNNVSFEPLHNTAEPETKSSAIGSEQNSDEERPDKMAQDLPTPTNTVKSEREFEVKNLWHAMSQGFRDHGNDSDSSHDDMREHTIRRAFEQDADNDDLLLFGSRSSSVNLSTLHPEVVQIFRLWQIYLDNVNPLLKVIHYPSMQGRIIEAAGNVTSIKPTLEALMFGIYSTAVMSLNSEDCLTIFGSSKEDLLVRYHFGCQQALSNCGFLRSSDRDCLTALYLYLISTQPDKVTPSLFSVLGIAIRIARRIGLHSESVLARSTVFEAEMGRRLWWALVLFDARICELTHSKTTTLDPTWDCNIPLSINDSDLRPEMKEPPTVQEKSSEAIFAVVRSEVGDFCRHSGFYLDFVNPALKPIARYLQDGVPDDGGLNEFERSMNHRYFGSCDQENPTHFMAIWTARTQIAKFRLLEHHSKFSNASEPQTETQRNTATTFALRMLECDTKLMSSPLTKNLQWLNYFHFPFIAYLQILQVVQRQPISERAQQSWEIMSDNYAAWFHPRFRYDSHVFRFFAKFVLKAWEGCEINAKQAETILAPPRIVLMIHEAQAQAVEPASGTNMDSSSIFAGMDMEDLQPLSMAFVDQSLSYNMAMESSGPSLPHPQSYSAVPGQLSTDAPMNQMNWAAFNGRPNWRGF